MKVVIVHGIADDEKDNPADNWISWVKEKLLEKNIENVIPLMPEPWNPNYLNWKKKFEQIQINEYDILIGHSGGCAFLVRWLGETNIKIKKLILVAPWKIASPEFSDGENELYDFEINKNIKENVDEIIVFTSDDEEEDGKKSAKIYSEKLDGELIELESHGHYCFGDMGTNEFPELLGEILE